MKKPISILLITVSVFAFTSCGRHIAQQKQLNQHAMYLCPMHKEYIASKPDKCPKCGMEMISYDDYRNSKSTNLNQDRMPDSHTGMGVSSGGHGGHH